MTQQLSNSATLVLGITGSLASGKSFVLSVFEKIGAAVQNSDIVVHELIEGAAFAEISKQFPEAVEANKINRKKLGSIVFADMAKLKTLEGILHPLVREKNLEFIKNNSHKKLVALEIPLLFETGAEEICNYTIFVEAPEDQRQQRAQSRSGIDAAQFKKISAHQMPDAEKKSRADFVINNEAGADVENQVKKILSIINKPCAK